MAWFTKSLDDLEKAINENDWDTAHKILLEHNRDYKNEAPQMEHEISSIGRNISAFGQNMDQAMLMLKAIKEGKDYKSAMFSKVKSAQNHVNAFEKTLVHLIKEGKFLE